MSSTTPGTSAHKIRSQMNTGTDAEGGYLTGSNLNSMIVDQARAVGVARRFAKQIEMSSNPFGVATIDARAVASVTAENDLVTISDPTFGQSTLTAVKVIVRGLASTELEEDAIDWQGIARSFGNSAATAEDACFFAEISAALPVGSKYVGEATLGALTLASFLELIALVPASAATPRSFSSHAAYALSSLSIQGQVGVVESVDGVDQGWMLGYPVTFSDSLPGAAAATASIPFLFGHMGEGAALGIRSELTTRQLNEISAATDQVQIVSSERIAAALLAPANNFLVGLELGV